MSRCGRPWKHSSISVYSQFFVLSVLHRRAAAWKRIRVSHVCRVDRKLSSICEDLCAAALSGWTIAPVFSAVQVSSVALRAKLWQATSKTVHPLHSTRVCMETVSHFSFTNPHPVLFFLPLWWSGCVGGLGCAAAAALKVGGSVRGRVEARGCREREMLSPLTSGDVLFQQLYLQVEDLLLEVTQRVFHFLPPRHHVAQVPHLKHTRLSQISQLSSEFSICHPFSVREVTYSRWSSCFTD